MGHPKMKNISSLFNHDHQKDTSDLSSSSNDNDPKDDTDNICDIEVEDFTSTAPINEYAGDNIDTRVVDERNTKQPVSHEEYIKNNEGHIVPKSSPITCKDDTEEVKLLWQEEKLSCKIFSKDKSAATRETCLQKANDICQKTCGSCPNSSPTPETFIPTSSPIEFKDSKEEVAFLSQENQWSCYPTLH